MKLNLQCRKPLIVTLLCCSIYTTAFSQIPIYFNIISHNEVTDTFYYNTSSSDYWAVTNVAKEIADTVIAKKAKWNIQVDANYIFGNIKYDNAYSNANDLLEWASKSAYIDVDGHNHFDSVVNPYNYADLAHLLQDSCGVVFGKNLTAGQWQTPNATWMQYQNPVNGYTFKSYAYQADILWGGGSPGHVNDINDYGVWKPAAPTTGLTFRQHKATNHLTYIGGGCKDLVSFTIDEQTGKIKLSTNQIIKNVKDMADYFNTLTPTGNEFYTLNMMINFRDFPNIPSFADSISRIIDGLDTYVKNGKIIWATLAEKHNTWYNLHTNAADHFNYECTNVPQGVIGNIGGTSEIAFYPNPVDRQLQISSKDDLVSLHIQSVDGKRMPVVYEGVRGKKILLNVSDYPPGIYIVSGTTTNGLFRKKVVVAH